jgi:lysophospholipase L1-like esterase
MKRLMLTLAVAAALAACGGGGGGGAPASFPVAGATVTADTPKDGGEVKLEQPAPPAPVPSCSFAYWGDSISAMTAPRIGKGIQVELHGVVGGTAQAAQFALLQDPLAARFIALEYGTNDSNGKVPYEPAMRAMLDRIKAVGRTPVIVGLPNATIGEATYHATYNALAGQLAQQYGALFVDWASVPWQASDLMPDGVHPKDDYQQRLADRITQVITDAAPECAAQP